MYVGLAGTASFFQLKYEFRILPKNPEFSEGRTDEQWKLPGDFSVHAEPCRSIHRVFS
jgi:hypothetical protein